MMSKRFLTFVAALLLLPASVATSFARENQPGNVSAEQKAEVVGKISDLLIKNYVFPETAQKMEALVRERLRKGDYSAISDGKEFAARLTEDLQSVSRDLHLRVSYSPEVIPAEPDKPFEPSPEFLEGIRRRQSRENFGVAKVEILKGNVGLIQFNYFTSPVWAGETYTAAMNYVANTDALIIDLRQNGAARKFNRRRGHQFGAHRRRECDDRRVRHSAGRARDLQLRPPAIELRLHDAH